MCVHGYVGWAGQLISQTSSSPDTLWFLASELRPEAGGPGEKSPESSLGYNALLARAHCCLLQDLSVPSLLVLIHITLSKLHNVPNVLRREA